MMKIWMTMYFVCAALFGGEVETNTFKIVAEELAKEREEKPMVLLIASYNNAPFWRKNLESVLSQKYQNFRVIYTNDASTDGTGEMVKEYMDSHRGEVRFTYIENKEQKGSAFNVDRMIRMCSPNEIVCILDGDDALIDSGVLRFLNYVYDTDDVWMSYGQFRSRVKEGTSRPIKMDLLIEGRHREAPWKTYGLRNFYAGLYLSIPKEKWLYEGKFIPVAHDVLQIYYLLDLAREHAYFLPKTLLFYNLDTGNNDSGVRREQQLYYEKLIREEIAPLEKMKSKAEIFKDYSQESS